MDHSSWKFFYSLLNLLLFTIFNILCLAGFEPQTAAVRVYKADDIPMCTVLLFERWFYILPLLNVYVPVKEVLSSLKIKNAEGYDRILQRVLVDGANYLIKSFEGLFERIYYHKTVPGQWLVSKTMPIFKNKGSKNEIENYRLISNLCSSSKIFEKLILKRIQKKLTWRKCRSGGLKNTLLINICTSNICVYKPWCH